jgi:hypothetical protein
MNHLLILKKLCDISSICNIKHAAAKDTVILRDNNSSHLHLRGTWFKFQRRKIL